MAVSWLRAIRGVVSLYCTLVLPRVDRAGSTHTDHREAMPIAGGGSNKSQKEVVNKKKKGKADSDDEDDIARKNKAKEDQKKINDSTRMPQNHPSLAALP